MGQDKTSKQKVFNAPTILKIVCRVYGVKIDDVLSRNRRRGESDARAVCAMMLRRFLHYTGTDIARYFRLTLTGGSSLLSRGSDLYEIDAAATVAINQVIVELSKLRIEAEEGGKV